MVYISETVDSFCALSVTVTQLCLIFYGLLLGFYGDDAFVLSFYLPCIITLFVHKTVA